MKRQSGNHNRYRTRRQSSYKRQHKAKVADRYGTYVNGVQKQPEYIGKYERASDREENECS